MDRRKKFLIIKERQKSRHHVNAQSDTQIQKHTHKSKHKTPKYTKRKMNGMQKPTKTCTLYTNI